MNNFSSSSSESNSKVPKHLESLATTAFRSLFPPINPQTTPLKSIRRVLLLNREPCSDEDGSFVLNFRHYAITTKTVGLPKPLKRLDAAQKLLHTNKSKKGGLPNLNKLQDIADYMIGGENGDGYMTDGTSGSEVETDAEVEVLESAPRKVLTAKARSAAAAGAEDEGASKAGVERDSNVERRAVKLVELGPRMRLRMIKVEEGMCSGNVMWHEYVHKSPAEIKQLEKKWEQRRKEKEARKKQQKENVEKKKQAKLEVKKSGGAGAGRDDDESDDDMDLDDVDSDFYDYEDQMDRKGRQGKAEEQGDWEDEDDEITGG
jgi:ribosome biogenesis protein SSF1/2